MICPKCKKREADLGATYCWECNAGQPELPQGLPADGADKQERRPRRAKKARRTASRG